MNDRAEQGPQTDSPPCHALSPAATLERLDAAADGLSTGEAEQRRARHGPNRLPAPARRSALARLLAQFHNVLIYVLLGAALLTAALGHWIDAGVILAVVVINAVIGFVQEGKAEHALDAIRGMLAPGASVLRDGRRVQLAAEALVPGDVVFLESGDRVPADLRLLRVKGLRIQEAALTGESVPVDKATEPVDTDAALGDRLSMAYSGTLVASGQGWGVVAATGAGTEIGRISGMLAAVTTLTTPLLRQLSRFSRRLTAGIVVLAAATFAFGVLARGYTAAEMFLAAVGLAVAAVPEGLPAIMTITLAIGVQRMAARNAIVRRLPAVETLGSVTVICSDKTGTLTRNEMMVQSVVTGQAFHEVTGTGYAPRGDILLDGEPGDIPAHPLLAEMIRGALLCSDATLTETDGAWTVAGDPTEGALVALAMKSGLDPAHVQRHWPRTDVIPFESEHRFMATLHHGRDGDGVLYVKGAPERLLSLCDHQHTPQGNEPIDRDYWERRIEEVTTRGQRVIALAARPADADHRTLDLHDIGDGDGLSFVGLFGLADPPRDEAIRAVAHCRAAGIRVKMVTGDHLGTARAIANTLGLDTGRPITGGELEGLALEALGERLEHTDVFARTSPEHKLRLVEALQGHGHVVAMTGDGVNDAPALKRADIGVAMGAKGTEAAREAAEMVLADDNFASIAAAVEEGRTVYDNLKKAIAFILPTNGGEALTLFAAIAAGMVLPITPVQILWINMVTAVTLALALAFEPTEPGTMQRPPRGADEPLLSWFLLWRIGFVSLILLAGTMGLFAFERASGTGVAEARTVAVNTLVLFEIFFLLNCRLLVGSAFSRRMLVGARPSLIAIVIVVALQLLLTYTPLLQLLFDTRALDAAAWARIVAVAATVFFLVEAEKAVLRRLQARRAHRATPDHQGQSDQGPSRP